MSTINPINEATKIVERSYQGSALTRTIHFYKEADSKERREFFIMVKTISVRTLVSYAAGGAISGGIVGGLTGGPPGILPGSAIGGAAGLAIGVLVASAKSCIKFRASILYRNWRDNAIQRGVYEQFVKFINTQDSFKSFICSISHAVPEVPVKAPCGHTHDKESIEGWLKNKPPGAHACPSRVSCKFSREDLEYDIDFVKRIVEFSRQIFENNTQSALEYKKFVGEGMGVYIENLRENHTNVGQQTLAELGGNLLRENASPEVAGEAWKALYERFLLKTPPS